MFKKIFSKSFICLIAVVFLVCGCGKKYENVSTIKFATWGSQSEIAILKPILKDFERKNPDIKIELMHIPENYFQKIHILFASKLEPDVVFMNNLNLPIYKDYLEDLTPYTDKTIFFEGAIQTLSFEKSLYVLPRDISTLVIFYNKEIFKKLNVKYPTENWSMQDFLSICKSLKTQDTFAISFEEDPFFYLPYVMSEKKVKNLRDITLSDLQFYADLRNKYNYAPTKVQTASATMANMFLQGKLAMHLSGRWLVPKYRQEANFDWDVINFPKGKQGSVVQLDASGWAISKSSKNKLDAIRLIQFLASKENTEKFTQSGLIVPARIDVAQSKIFLNDKLLPKNPDIFVKTIYTAHPTPTDKYYKQNIDDLKQKTEKLFN